MKEQLTVFKTARLAKEKGFNISTYSNCWVKTLDGKIMHNSERRDCAEHDRCETYLSQPSQTMLQKWLREVHNINVYCVCRGGEWTYWIDKTSPLSQESTTYEKALEEGLQEGLNLI